MQEIWKDVVGFNGDYKVSNTGKILTVAYGPKTCSVRHCKKSEIMKTSISRTGYERVHLFKQGKDLTRYVHRLVAEAFISNPDNLPQVNHKDGNKLNNCVDNLEWVTASQNQCHAIDLGLRASSPNLGKFGDKNPLSKSFSQYDLNGNFIKQWKGISETAKTLGFSFSELSRCLNGRRKTCRGYIWKFDN